jgi:tRNA nucleotidyltransferase (CCA-adding enzyme)
MKAILDAIVAAGGLPLYVGGFVRDTLWGLSPKDFDIEVHSLSAEKLESVLSQYGSVNAVGKSFGILKLRLADGMECDFSLPRRENKQGKGHKGFIVEVDPSMGVREAAARRDYTINSMAMGVDGVVIDEFDGVRDMRNRILRPTSEAFSEDALRILRGMQFAGRFNMTAHGSLQSIGPKLREEYKDLAKERVWGEWEKWASKSVHPSYGIHFLHSCDWLLLYPELYALRGVAQDKEWHPEGDVYWHTLHVVDEMANIVNRENIQGEDRLVLIFAALTHDLGKPATTEFKDGRWRAHGHCEMGVAIAERFLQSIGCLQRIIDRVKPLVAEHLAHVRETHTKRTVRRLANRLFPATVQELSYVIEADMGGRPPLPRGLPDCAKQMLEVAREVHVEHDKVQPLVMGRHLIERGFVPGKALGVVLKAAYDAQLEGEFDNLEDGIKWITNANPDGV